jgi:uncharacterized membrane protein required for colicin V production
VALDVIAVALFLALAFLGWRSGLTSQLIRLGALAAVVVASPFVASVLRESFFGEVTVSEPMIEGVCVFAAGILIYFGISLAGWLAVRTMRKASETLSKTDRAAGGVVGALKAGLIVYLLVFVAIFIEKGLEKTDPDDNLRIRDSALSATVKDNNVLAPWYLPKLGTVHDMVKVAVAAKEQNQSQILRDNSVASDVLRRDRIKGILADDALVDSILRKSYPEMLADGRIRDLLRDDELMKVVDAVDWAALADALDPKVDQKPNKIEFEVDS